jgi:curli biogenesis system outer membrane secretion channel CsgG
MNRGRYVRAAVAAFACLLIAAAAQAQGSAEGWHPFLSDKKGEVSPFPEGGKGLKDKEWLSVGYTKFAGFKPRLGVVFSEEKQQSQGQYTSEWARLMVDLYGRPTQGTNPFNHIEDLVRQALGATNRFTMVERTTATDDVLGEQDFGASGRVDKKTAAQTGKMKGSDYVVKATIIELNPEKESKTIKAIGGGMGATALGIGSIGVTGKVAFCRLNVRLVNSTTGEIVQDMTVDGTSSASGLSLGAGLLKATTRGMAGGGGAYSSKKAALLSDAMLACASKVAYFTAVKMEEIPWQGSVASVNGSRVTINAGTNVGLKEGLTLKLLSKGEEIKDPDSGESLGFEAAELGTIRITSVQEKFSVCDIVEGGEGVKKGDIVRLEPQKK